MERRSFQSSYLSHAGINVVQAQRQRAGQKTFEGSSGFLDNDLKDSEKPLHGSNPVRIFLPQYRFNVELIERLQERLDSFLGSLAPDLIEQAVENGEVKIEDGLRHLCNIIQ